MSKNLKFLFINIICVVLYNLILIIPMGAEDTSTLVDDIYNLIYLIIQAIMFICIWLYTINFNKNIDRLSIIINVIFIITYMIVLYSIVDIYVINCSIWILGILSIILRKNIYDNTNLPNIMKNIIYIITFIILTLLFIPFVNSALIGNMFSIILIYIIASIGNAININLILYNIYSKHNNMDNYNTDETFNKILTVIIITIIILLNGNMAIELSTFNSKASRYIKGIETSYNSEILEKNMLEFSENKIKGNYNSIFNYKRIMSYFNTTNEGNLKILKESKGKYDQNYMSSVSQVLEQFLKISQLNNFMIVAVMIFNCINIYVINFYKKR